MSGATCKLIAPAPGDGTGHDLAFALIGLVVGLAGPALGNGGDTVRAAGGRLLPILGSVKHLPALNKRCTNLMNPLASGADQLSAKLNAGSLGRSLLPGALRDTLIPGAFGAAAATPLVLAAHASRAGFAKAGGWVPGHAGAMKTGFEILLVQLGGAILMGWDKRLEALVLPLLRDAWVNLTVAI